MIPVATLTNQTFLITPRYAGQIVRFGGVQYVAVANERPVRVYGSGLVELGGGWWDHMLITDGEYNGYYFDGSFPDQDGPTMHDYEWLGAVDASSSTHQTGQTVGVPDPEKYAAALEQLSRHMHTVTAVSGPTIVQKLHRGEVYGYLVEFVLVSGVPWSFGLTKPVESASNPSLPEVIQDIPFNLVPYPSAEVALGTVVAATNLSTNPSVELDGAGWTAHNDGVKITGAMMSIARSTELDAVGSASVKALFTATTTDTAGYFGAGQVVAVTTLAGIRFSLNLWASGSVQSGTAVLGTIQYFAHWQDAAGTTLRTDEFGSNPSTGGAVSQKSVLPPAGTTKVLVRARQNVTSWSTGAVIRLYVDALAVTVP